jgi:hypothetical protein
MAFLEPSYVKGILAHGMSKNRGIEQESTALPLGREEQAAALDPTFGAEANSNRRKGLKVPLDWRFCNLVGFSNVSDAEDQGHSIVW